MVIMFINITQTRSYVSLAAFIELTWCLPSVYRLHSDKNIKTWSKCLDS